MKLKRPLNEVAHEMQQSAYYAAKHELTTNNYSGNHMDPMVSLSDSIARAVGKAVFQAMMALERNQYTDEDFEKDIGLKP